MIPIKLPNPPQHYGPEVKQKGMAFLKAHPNPTHKEWQKHDHWQSVHDDLYSGLSGICMYSASWTPRKRAPGADEATTVDHYIPKSVDPEKAYEWSNFRICRSRLNQRKDNHRDVLDPCGIPRGWFAIDFATFRVGPKKGLSNKDILEKIENTTKRLQLNDDVDYVNERINVIKNYVLDRISIEQVMAKWPFIGQEIVSQSFDRKYKSRLKEFFTASP